MAQDRPGGEPTEAPTPRRLRDARRRGQVARSQKLTAAVGFAAAAGVLLWAGDALLERLQAATRAGLSRAVSSGDPTGLIAPVIDEAIRTVVLASLPIVGAAAAAAAIAGFAQVGPLFTGKPLVPDLARLNPIAGARRLLSPRTWFELAKSIVEIAIVGWLAYDALAAHAGDFARLAGAPLALTFPFVATVAGELLFRVALFYALAGVADLLWQRRMTNEELMMTRDEVKRERKQQEGDPQHKAERRRLHRDLLQHQRMESVRTADAVIVNPEHVAVAIRYDQDRMHAPRVVAIGRGLVAQQIKDVARRFGVPIYRDVPLARALADLELDANIPEALYEAVAAVLRLVYERRTGGA